MADVIGLGLALVSGGLLTATGKVVLGAIASNRLRKSDIRDTDVKLEEHRDQLTLDMLSAARVEMRELRAEVAELRPISARLIHLEECLDHLDALLHAEDDATWDAAARRAQAFLKRMRPAVGDLRNEAQIRASARHIADDSNPT